MSDKFNVSVVIPSSTRKAAQTNHCVRFVAGSRIPDQQGLFAARPGTCQNGNMARVISGGPQTAVADLSKVPVAQVVGGRSRNQFDLIGGPDSDGALSGIPRRSNGAIRVVATVADHRIGFIVASCIAATGQQADRAGPGKHASGRVESTGVDINRAGFETSVCVSPWPS